MIKLTASFLILAASGAAFAAPPPGQPQPMPTNGYPNPINSNPNYQPPLQIQNPGPFQTIQGIPIEQTVRNASADAESPGDKSAPPTAVAAPSAPAAHTPAPAAVPAPPAHAEAPSPAGVVPPAAADTVPPPRTPAMPDSPPPLPDSVIKPETQSPPPSHLGTEVASPPPQAEAEFKVVYPKTGELIESEVSMAEQLQLTPQQIDRLKSIRLRRDQASATPYVVPPDPITRTLMVNLDPGVAPEALRLAYGLPSTVVFSDRAGNPWNIVHVEKNDTLFRTSDVGGQGNVQGAARDNPPEPQGAGAHKTNILSIEPKNTAAYGSITVTLEGLPTPVIFMLITSQPQVDMRVDAKVPGHNPNALDSLSVNDLPMIDGDLSNFLDNVPPRDAERLAIDGLPEAMAWRYRDNLYLRVKADALNPAYFNAARSTSGISVYRYNGIPAAVNLLANGRAQTVFIH